SSGNFQTAAQKFGTAKSQYISALSRVADDAELAKWQEEQKKEAEAWRKTQLELAKRNAQPKDTGTPFNPGQPNPGTEGGPAPPTGFPGGTPGVGVGDIASPAVCFEEYATEDYPNELDEEDEAFLQEHIRDLTPLGAASYDPITGKILLDYSIGRVAKKEINVLKTKKKHLDWEDFTTKAVPTDQLDPEATFGLGGNTDGFVIAPVPFRYGVKVTFDMNILTMTGAGSFGVVVNFDPKKKSFYRTNFLNIARVTSGSIPKWKPVKGEKGTKNANYWADKTRRIPWDITYEMPNPDKASKGPTKSARVSVTYDIAGDDETANIANMTSRMQRGYVGFMWNQVKFRLFKLKICGVIDKEMAVAELRRKLGIKKGAKPKDDPEDEVDDNPTIPEGDKPADVDDI
ncbi:MAG: hypothetical protein AAF517_05040, partial [Planctomycetota bacterium]